MTPAAALLSDVIALCQAESAAVRALLASLEQDVQALQAMVGGLQGEIEHMRDTKAEIAALQAENERLREACRVAEYAFRVPAGTRVADELRALTLLRVALASGEKADG